MPAINELFYGVNRATKRRLLNQQVIDRPEPLPPADLRFGLFGPDDTPALRSMDNGRAVYEFRPGLYANVRWQRGYPGSGTTDLSVDLVRGRFFDRYQIMTFENDPVIVAAVGGNPYLTCLALARMFADFYFDLSSQSRDWGRWPSLSRMWYAAADLIGHRCAADTPGTVDSGMAPGVWKLVEKPTPAPTVRQQEAVSDEPVIVTTPSPGGGVDGGPQKTAP